MLIKSTVIISQADSLQGHKHDVYAVNSSQNLSILLGAGDSGFGCSSLGTRGTFVAMGGMKTFSGYGNVRYSKETRSQNITQRMFKRIA